MIKNEFSNLPTDLFGRLETDGFAIVDDAIDGTLLKSVVQDSAILEKNRTGDCHRTLESGLTMIFFGFAFNL